MSKTIVQLSCLIVVLACLTMAVTIAVAQVSQTSADKETVSEKAPARTVIDPNSTLLSWGAVAALLAVAGTAITAMVTSRNHISDANVHHSGEKLSDKFVSKVLCDQQHREAKEEFRHVHERFDDLKKEIAEGNVSIASSLASIQAKLDK